VQEWFIRPIDQNIWQWKRNRCTSARILDHCSEKKQKLRVLRTRCWLLIPAKDGQVIPRRWPKKPCKGHSWEVWLYYYAPIVGRKLICQAVVVKKTSVCHQYGCDAPWTCATWLRVYYVPGNVNVYSKAPHHVSLNDSLHDSVSWNRSS